MRRQPHMLHYFQNSIIFIYSTMISISSLLFHNFYKLLISYILFGSASSQNYTVEYLFQAKRAWVFQKQMQRPFPINSMGNQTKIKGNVLYLYFSWRQISQQFLFLSFLWIQNLLLGMKENPKRKNINIDDIIIKLNQTPYNERSFALREYEIQGLCVMIKNIMIEQPMLLELEAPIQICGDTHGQFSDLQTIFKLFGTPDKRNYLFLGDYVDRGKQSLECICLLMAYKIKHPDNFFLLRGNHESSQLNKLYGFYDECKRRMTVKIWKIISDTFNFFPIAAVISNRIFCVHGGLSPLVKSISSLNSIKRPIQPAGNKIISDMLWSDPKPTTDGWSDNFQRGISYYYGKNVIDLFLNKNQFDLICRSHQVVEDGYEFGYEKKLITIFSAPNYCGQFTNLAAVLKISAQLMCRIEQFEGQPLFIKKRNRSVTPIRKIALENNQKESLTKKQNRGEEVKTRKATKIMKVQMQKIDQSSLNLDDETLQPEQDLSKTE